MFVKHLRKISKIFWVDYSESTPDCPQKKNYYGNLWNPIHCCQNFIFLCISCRTLLPHPICVFERITVNKKTRGKCFQSTDENKPGNCGWMKIILKQKTKTKMSPLITQEYLRQAECATIHLNNALLHAPTKRPNVWVRSQPKQERFFCFMVVVKPTNVFSIGFCCMFCKHVAHSQIVAKRGVVSTAVTRQHLKTCPQNARQIVAILAKNISMIFAMCGPSSF